MRVDVMCYATVPDVGGMISVSIHGIQILHLSRYCRNVTTAVDEGGMASAELYLPVFCVRAWETDLFYHRERARGFSLNLPYTAQASLFLWHINQTHG